MPRKKPFSSKQKKLQLQQKRSKKRAKGEGPSEPISTPPCDPRDDDSSTSASDSELGQAPPLVDKLNQQPGATSTKYDPNRYRLHFERETREEIERRKTDAKTVPLTPVPETAMEVSVEDIYHPGSVLDIPKRPPWSYHMSKEEVERQEEAMFERYLTTIHSHHKAEDLSYFEHNLETWRQLWRVLEISDVVLLIADVRHPALHFSPALYSYVVEDLKKQLVLVLNKVDLVPPQVAVAWRHYFLTKFPGLNVICFTCHPNPQASLQPTKKVSLKLRRKGRGKLPSAVGPSELFKVIEAMYKKTIDLAEWKQRLEGDDQETGDTIDYASGSDSEEEEVGEEVSVTTETTAVTSSPLIRDDVSDSVLTVGMIGHPNVGKSSLLNGLMGKKLVSVSRTPGHTKHFQTIFLTRTIRLCDCPGLVFPSLVSRQLQILSGMYPIAQVREPYTAVGYLVERMPLVKLLQLEHPDSLDALVSKNKARSRARQSPPSSDGSRDELTRSNEASDRDELWDPSQVAGGGAEEMWTAWNICDAWAEKRKYYTTRAARHDTYRAANSILRLAVDGRIVMFFRPPGFSQEKANWEHHPEVADMIQLQQKGLHGPRGEEGEREGEEGTLMAMGKEEQQMNKFALLMTLEDEHT